MDCGKPISTKNFRITVFARWNLMPGHRCGGCRRAWHGPEQSMSRSWRAFIISKFSAWAVGNLFHQKMANNRFGGGVTLTRAIGVGATTVPRAALKQTWAGPRDRFPVQKRSTGHTHKHRPTEQHRNVNTTTPIPLMRNSSPSWC